MMNKLTVCLTTVVLAVSNVYAFDLNNLLKDRKVQPAKQADQPSRKASPQQQVGQPQTKEPIQPFGNLLWEDGLLDVVNKLNGLKGLESLQLYMSDRSVSLVGINDEASLEKKLTDLLNAYNPIVLNPKEYRRYSMLLEEYIGTGGQKKKYFATGFRIKATSIIIADLPFELTVVLENQAGLEAYKQEKVVTEKRGNYPFPLIIKEVQLDSNSAAIPDKMNELKDIIKKKYAKYDADNILFSDRRERGFEGSVSDEQRNSITIDLNPKSCRIVYRSDAYKNRLQEEYRKLKAKLEQKGNAGKQDMGSGL